MVDSIYRTRSLGVASEGIPDQYADGKAAKVWEYYIGSRNERTDVYRSWITQLLREKNCKRVLDVACGTGIDSVMLLEEGFEVVSVDASDKMIMQAFKERWSRRKEDAFDKWEIEVANWLTLPDDLPSQEGKFDAVICLGNSFANLPDFEGNLSNQRLALKNFADLLRPGGIMVIDHRNYDSILDTGRAPVQNIYYHGNCIKDIQTSTLYINGRPSMVTLDYFIDINVAKEDIIKKGINMPKKKLEFEPVQPIMKFRLSYYPHRLNAFTELLKEAFGAKCGHDLLADFKKPSEVAHPAYYIHTVEKPL
ncbi:glycine N-methyltransferase [Strongylocentrotus purpuratus]|uniref:Glycine N-methyltransferase n=1 Tax=Strongylocentrotus purpuratus TaxID=7668 RepID=A0A7M7HKQ6_STRPU|nr:glycine N-methyltransferase [Strongylocentrotus purpuratus]